MGLLAGLVQATTSWTVLRGRLAEADILLACLVAATLLAFDHLRGGRLAEPDIEPPDGTPPPPAPADRPLDPGLALGLLRGTRADFAGQGGGLRRGPRAGGGCPGSGLGPRRPGLATTPVPPGWCLSALLGLAWPLLAAVRHPSAVGLWALHVTDRLSATPEQFAGQGLWAYSWSLLAALLPWTPLVLPGAWRSIPRALARGGRGGGDRFLWAWAVGPMALLSLATVRNAHYAIHALPPFSVWAAPEPDPTGGPTPRPGGGRRRRVGYSPLGPVSEPSGWPTPSASPGSDPGSTAAGKNGPFMSRPPAGSRRGSPSRSSTRAGLGPLPVRDPVRALPARLGGPALLPRPPEPCVFQADDLKPAAGAPAFAVIGRESDREALARLGTVETLDRGLAARADRAYVLYRVTPLATPVAARPGGPVVR